MLLDRLDFIQPSQWSPMKLLQQVPHFTESHTHQGKNSHALKMLFPVHLHVDSAISNSQVPVDRCRDAFLSFAVTETALSIGDRCVQVHASNYDGSVVSFEVTDEEGKLKLSITTSTASCMVEIVSCVHRKVVQERNVSFSEFNADVLTSLQVCDSNFLLHLLHV